MIARNRRIATLLTVAALLLGWQQSALSQEFVPVGGTVVFGSTPLCALVLVNGQDQFSCGGGGSFDMTAPPDSNGMLTLQVFADGFAPVRADYTPAQATNIQVEMERSTANNLLDVDATFAPDIGSANPMMRVKGTVTTSVDVFNPQDTPIAVCALVLANGQKMFSCGTDLGVFDLNVPVNPQNGGVELQIFAAGFQPFNLVYIPGQPVARFSGGQQCGDAFAFDGSSSTAGSDSADSTIASYAWDFGDGNTSTEQDAHTTHTYANAGKYVVTLTVTDVGGRSGSKKIAYEYKPSGSAGNLVCGTISVPDNYVIDSDINDPLAPYVSNDTVPQPLPVPATVFGYLNGAGVGNAGRSFASGDSVDQYTFEAKGGEEIVLKWAGGVPTSFSVTLNRANSGTVVAGGALINLQNPEGFPYRKNLVEPGLYTLEINVAKNTANTYELSLISPDALTGLQQPDAPVTKRMPARRFAATDNFVPGDVVVAFDNQSAAKGALEGGGIGNLTVIRDLTDGLVLLRVPPASAGASDEAEFIEAYKRQTIAAIETISAQPHVRYAEPNMMRYAAQALPTNDPQNFAQAWYMNRIKAPAAWQITTGSDNVTVAVLDSGAFFAHADMAGRYDTVNAFDFISTPSQPGSALSGGSNDGDGRDSDASDPGQSVGCPGGDVVGFHGLFVAGIIGAATNNNLLLSGVTHRGRILPLRVQGDCGRYLPTADIADAIRYAAGLSNSTGKTIKAVDVINMSFYASGAQEFSQAEQDAVTAARAAGVVLVASAGNKSSDGPAYPANYQGVISVSAIDKNDALSSFSNFGSGIDIAAPGGTSLTVTGTTPLDEAIATLATDGAQSLTGLAAGTSFAAPQVSGVIALMKAVHPGLTPADVDTLLAAGSMTDDLGDPGRDNFFGHGVLNAEKAVKAAQALANTGPVDPPVNPPVDPPAGSSQPGNAGRLRVAFAGALGSISPGSASNFVILDSTGNGKYDYKISVPPDQLLEPSFLISAATNLDNAAGVTGNSIVGVSIRGDSEPIPAIRIGNQAQVDFGVTSTMWK